MNGYLILISLFFSFSANAQRDSSSAYDQMLQEHYEFSVPFIYPDELYHRITTGAKLVLLDTREQKEFEISTIQGAQQVGFLFYSKKRVESLNKNDLIVVYCTIGARSETIGERLINAGYTNVYNLYGGLIHWKNMGYPVYNNGVETKNVHVYSKKWGLWLEKGNPVY